MMTLLTLIFSAWEEMKEANRWGLFDVGTDYLISLSNWPESGCCCFASAELTHPKSISVYKSIRGCLFIFLMIVKEKLNCHSIKMLSELHWWQSSYNVKASSLNYYLRALCPIVLAKWVWENRRERESCAEKIISQWLLCCGNQIKDFPPRKMKFHLIDKVMMYAMGQTESGDNDASHLTYLLDYHLQFYGWFTGTLSPLF